MGRTFDGTDEAVEGDDHDDKRHVIHEELLGGAKTLV
jgi:hypothetical protein